MLAFYRSRTPYREHMARLDALLERNYTLVETVPALAGDSFLVYRLQHMTTPKRVLVAGGAGFIGRNAAARFSGPAGACRVRQFVATGLQAECAWLTSGRPSHPPPPAEVMRPTRASALCGRPTR